MTDLQAWRDLLERVVRAVLQALTPVLLIVSTSGSLPDFPALGLSLVAIVVPVCLKYWRDYTAPADAPLWKRLADRVASAAATGALAFIPADWNGSFGAVDWGAAGWAAIGSAGLALVMLYGAPPSQGVHSENDLLHVEPGHSD